MKSYAPNLSLNRTAGPASLPGLASVPATGYFSRLGVNSFHGEIQTE